MNGKHPVAMVLQAKRDGVKVAGAGSAKPAANNVMHLNRARPAYRATKLGN